MLKDFAVGMDFGAGVNDGSGNVRNIVVIGDPPAEVAGTAQVKEFELTKVESYQELLDSMGLSIGAEGSYGLIGGSEKFNFAEGRKFHAYSVFMMVHVRILNPIKQIKNERLLDPTVANLLTGGNNARFVERCGHLYVKGIQTGGEYFAVVEIVTKDEGDRKEISNRVDAGGIIGAGGFDVAVQFGQQMSSIAQTNRLEILSYQIGGPDRIDLTIDQILNTVQAFPATVRTSSLPCKVFLQDYQALDLPTPPTWVDLLQQKELLQEALDVRTPLVQKLNEVDFILLHPDQFETPGTDLNQLRTDVAKAIRTVTDRASECLNDVMKCQFPGSREGDPVFRVPDLAGIPKRKQIGPTHISIPNLVGELQETAENDCRNLGLALQVRNTVDQRGSPPPDPFFFGTKATVIAQSPAAGEPLQVGGVISVDILLTSFQRIPH